MMSVVPKRTDFYRVRAQLKGVLRVRYEIATNLLRSATITENVLRLLVSANTLH